MTFLWMPKPGDFWVRFSSPNFSFSNRYSRSKLSSGTVGSMSSALRPHLQRGARYLLRGVPPWWGNGLPPALVQGALAPEPKISKPFFFWPLFALITAIGTIGLVQPFSCQAPLLYL